MVTYPGLPAPAISDWLSRDASSSRYAPGTTFQIGKIEMLANTGTYIDAPFHRYDGRQDIGDYPLESVADLEGVVIRATERKGRALDAAWFGGHDVRGKAVLVHTGWDAHWRTERYGSGHPFLTRDAVEHLVSAGAALVGRAPLRHAAEERGPPRDKAEHPDRAGLHTQPLNCQNELAQLVLPARNDAGQ